MASGSSSRTSETASSLLDDSERSVAGSHMRIISSKQEGELDPAVLQARIEKLLEQNRIITDQKVKLEVFLDDILNSKSWKLTAPLRAFTGFIRQCRPVFRFRTSYLTLHAGRNVEVQGDHCNIIGPTPYCLLKPKAGPMPTGWVKIRPTLSLSGEHMFFALYYRSKGADFLDQNRTFLPLADGATEEFLVRLPLDNEGLRLDPFVTEGAFSVKKLEVRELGKLQLIWAMVSKQLRSATRNPYVLVSKAKRLVSILREGGLTALRIKLFANHFTNNYQEWVEKYDTLSVRDYARIKERAEALPYKPLISVIMPTYNTPERWLRKAIESVQAQLYTNWELCIADDASTDRTTKRVLAEISAADKRIKIHYREANGHIATASNDALALATGEFIALLDHDDELREHALYMVAHELNCVSDAGLIYSDEDKITSYGMRFNPYFKSDWNPDLFLSQNYVCHLSVMRTSIVREVGGFSMGVDGAQDWDILLRVSEKLKETQIRHIPHVLYHWRVIEGSTAQSTAHKPYVLDAQRKSVLDHLERVGVRGATVKILEDIAHLRVQFPVPQPPPLVSIIIPTRNRIDLLERCVQSILEKTQYEPFEIIIADNGSNEPETLAYFESLTTRYAVGKKTVRIVPDPRPFNFSAINNFAASHAKGSILAFLNNDLEVVDRGWLGELVSYAVRPEIGQAGARLLYPNNLLQHGGIILGIGGVAGHNHKGRLRQDPGYFNRAILPQDLSAVTAACVAMRRDVFEQVHGFDEELSVAFNDVDLSLRVRAQGYRIVYTPYAELYHYESASRGYENTPEKFVRFEREIETMKKRWKGTLNNDPYYNPNLSLITEDFALSFPPRAHKPWLDARK